MKRLFKNLDGFFLLILVIFLILFQIVKHNFNGKILNADNVYKNTAELSSAKYDGRQAGSDGNMKALKYIEDYFRSIGISPAGEKGTYYQSLKTMIPLYNKTPEFIIKDKNSNVVKSFKYGDDFRDILKGSGGAGSINGKLYLLNGDIKKVSSEVLRNFIILSSASLGDMDLKYAADNGCRAIIFPADVTVKEPFDMSSKDGKSMLIYKISNNTLDFLMAHIKDDINACLNLDVSFKMEETPNILGKIEGRDKSAGYLFISSHIDGRGDMGNGSFVPGSLQDASGTAMMLELARALKLQKSKPEKTIVFAAWNSFEERRRGSRYYVDNPLYPLDKSQVIVLDGLGSNVSDHLYFLSNGTAGGALMGELLSYFSGSGFNTMLSRNIYGDDTEAFLLKDVPAVLLCGGTDGNFIGTVNENINYVSKERLNSVGSVLLSYLQREVYKDWFNGLLTPMEMLIFCVLVMIRLFAYLLKLMYMHKLMPSRKFENLYYSIPFGIIDKATQIMLTMIFAAFLILFIIYIPNSFDIVSYKGNYYTNYSLYMVAQKAVTFAREFVSHGFGSTQSGFSILYIMSFSIVRSIILILCSITLAFFLGTLSGAVSGFTRRKNSSVRFLGSIAVLSFPDVFIAILLQLLIAFLYKHRLLLFLIGIDEKSRFIVPFICLAVIPTAYISRIAQIAVREEMNKDYIIAAKAKGLSNFNILKNHLLISVIIKVVEALPSVLNIIISNLIIVEYFFAYPGIVYQLFNYFRDGDRKACAGFIIGIGIVYCILTFVFKLISIIINPIKRRNNGKSTAVL